MKEEKIKSRRVLAGLFLIVSTTSIIILNKYPTGNFIGAPVITTIFYFPLGFINVIFIYLHWFRKNRTQKYYRKLIIGSIVITSAFVAILLFYIVGNQQ